MSEEDLQSFKDWKKHPITKLIFKYLEERHKDFQELLESESTLYTDYYDRHSAKLIGAIQVINSLLNIEYQEVKQVKAEDTNE